ncbi:hypothetical protein H9P43_008493 [Blastocladiella emersonii ATCC 22665]|nr:hypothetical protein H9P43_008493 [Blastocladiella emersonii ATCC 22665]
MIATTTHEAPAHTDSPIWIRAFYNQKTKSLKVDHPRHGHLPAIRRQLQSLFAAEDSAGGAPPFFSLEYLGDEVRVPLRTQADWLTAVDLVHERERAHLHLFCVDAVPTDEEHRDELAEEPTPEIHTADTDPDDTTGRSPSDVDLRIDPSLTPDGGGDDEDPLSESGSSRGRRSRRSSVTFVQTSDWNFSPKVTELRDPQFESRMSLIDERVVAAIPPLPPKPKAAVPRAPRRSSRSRSPRDRPDYDYDGQQQQQRTYPDQDGESEYDDYEDSNTNDWQPTSTSPLPPLDSPAAPRYARSLSPDRPPRPPMHSSNSEPTSPTQPPPLMTPSGQPLKSILKKRVSFSGDSTGPKGYARIPPLPSPTRLTDYIPEDETLSSSCANASAGSMSPVSPHFQAAPPMYAPSPAMGSPLGGGSPVSMPVPLLGMPFVLVPANMVTALYPTLPPIAGPVQPVGRTSPAPPQQPPRPATMFERPSARPEDLLAHMPPRPQTTYPAVGVDPRYGASALGFASGIPPPGTVYAQPHAQAVPLPVVVTGPAARAAKSSYYMQFVQRHGHAPGGGGAAAGGGGGPPHPQK